MRLSRLLAPALTLMLATCVYTEAQDIEPLKQLWRQTLDAQERGQKDQAQALFRQFNQRVRSYLQANGPNWQVEYLAGSLNCQFSETKPTGVKLLQDVLQNNRTLNSAGQQELRKQIAACSAPAISPVSGTQPELPQDVADASAHFQLPGVHGDMKGGYRFEVNEESASPVSPIPAAQLLTRRFELGNSNKALDSALARFPVGAAGGVVSQFAVVTKSHDKSYALGVGKCLENYGPPLLKQFDIKPSKYVVTVYSAETPSEVYEYARQLHGLQLPSGVVAYSIAEDMSLTAIASPTACGSMAHELVHLLIKQNFPLAPPWLEEGLASEVAVASPAKDQFRFSYSWREDTLRKNSGLKPTVTELLALPWSDLNSHRMFDMNLVAARQAMVAVFVRYLDSRGKLSDIYFAVRDHHVSPDLSDYKSYREILEQHLNMDVDAINRDFSNWFERETSSRRVSRDVTAQPTVAPNSTTPCQSMNMSAEQVAACREPAKKQQNAPPMSE